jgi:hypothetical protein
MRLVVATRFFGWTATFETIMRKLYCDVKGYVSIGDGLLCSKPLALTLSFVHDSDGSPASLSEVSDAWDAVFAARASGVDGGAHFEELTTISATMASLNIAGASKLRTAENYLRRFFPAWEDACADAQLPALSKAWADGPLFEPKWPKFTAAFNACDFAECANQATPSDEEMARQNPSFRRRIASEIAHLNAAVTSADPEAFAIWP